jgi:hypothetical protein
MRKTRMNSVQALFDQPVIVEEEYDCEPGYTPRRRIYLGLRYRFTIRDQIGSPVDIYVDRKDQVFSFINGFDAVLQKGQVVRFECDMLGLHGWIHGKYPEIRDVDGRRIMPRHGNPVFDAFVTTLDVSPQVQEELRAWEEYTAHNPDWYFRKMQKRIRDHG